jgi:hypothetical protein
VIRIYAGLNGARVRLLGRRPPSVRGPSAERPLGLDRRIPGAHLGWKVEFITCTVGDTTLTCISG